MKKIKKAVITAAGLATRMMPIAKSVPKAMLPIVDKPGIQYLIEEAVAGGITDILLIVGHGAHLIEGYLDGFPGCRISYMQQATPPGQKKPPGLGHAVLCAKDFANGDDFAVMYGDDIIIGGTPAIGELARVHADCGVSVAGVKQVARADLSKYCSLKVEPAGNPGEFFVYDMNEKPQSDEQIFSDYAILGRVILTPEIFGILENQPPGANGEIQLTDSMKTLAQSGAPGAPKMMAKVFTGERHDMGSKFGFLRANILEGLQHPETGSQLREFLRGLEL